jgi:hypothetical protein
MTNRSMVNTEKAAADADASAGPTRAMPEPNPPSPQPLPAPESEPHLLQSREPLDSPQPKPMIKQGKAHGLKTAEQPSLPGIEPRERRASPRVLGGVDGLERAPSLA